MDSSPWVRDETGSDRGVDSLAPDHMTPDQFTGMLRRHSWRNGEHRLLAAVLQEAIETFHKCAFADAEEKKAQFSEVYQWVTDRENHSLFAFPTICEVLNLNPDCMREGLLAWYEQHQKRPISIGARHLADPRRQADRFAQAV